MFDIGIQELAVIFVIVLLVFGPKRLPELARTMGKAFGQLRRAMYDIKSEVEREIQEETGQIKHDLPDWKDKYPFNKPPSKDQGKGINEAVQEKRKNNQTPDTATDNAAESAEATELAESAEPSKPDEEAKPAKPAEESSSEESPTTETQDEARDT